MKTSGSITLGEAAEHTAVLTVGCTRCERAGQYSLNTLIARHGEDFGIPDLLRLLSDDCSKRKSITVYDLCGIHCRELPSFFLGSGSWRGPLQRRGRATEVGHEICRRSLRMGVDNSRFRRRRLLDLVYVYRAAGDAGRCACPDIAGDRFNVALRHATELNAYAAVWTAAPVLLAAVERVIRIGKR